MLDRKIFEVDRDMLIFAVRYAIGRQTFAPIVVVENVMSNIERLEINDIDIIINDIESHIGSYGAQCDEDTWMNFRTVLKHELDKRMGAEWVN